MGVEHLASQFRVVRFVGIEQAGITQTPEDDDPDDGTPPAESRKGGVVHAAAERPICDPIRRPAMIARRFGQCGSRKGRILAEALVPDNWIRVCPDRASGEHSVAVSRKRPSHHRR